MGDEPDKKKKKKDSKDKEKEGGKKKDSKKDKKDEDNTGDAAAGAGKNKEKKEKETKVVRRSLPVTWCVLRAVPLVKFRVLVGVFRLHSSGGGIARPSLPRSNCFDFWYCLNL